MELYTLNANFQNEEVVDQFSSLIWSERWREFGDFDLSIFNTRANRVRLSRGTMLACNLSKRVMMVETIEDKLDSDGKPMLHVTGRSIEAILEERGNRRSGILSGGVIGDWNVTNPPATIIRSAFDMFCRSNTILPADNLPNLATGSLYPPSTIAESPDPISLVNGFESLYSMFTTLSKTYGLGFRLVRSPVTNKFHFDVYAGNDRTTSQASVNPIIFSPSLENMTNVTQLTSIEKYKNVAYVLGKNGSLVVYDASASENTTGFDRRVLMVDAKDIETAAGAALNTQLLQRGNEELAKYRLIEALDGEIDQRGAYRYDVDYTVGDMVEMRGTDGVINRMRVTEQIFVDDPEGERAYPTLESEMFVTVGSWFSWDYNGVWDTADGTWDTV